MTFSARAEIITRRSYCRSLDSSETEFESWDEVCERVYDHQKKLWENAIEQSLSADEITELSDFYDLLLKKKAFPSGRTLWLGGTEIAYRRPASQFNCAFTTLKTVHDFVDMFWLLLQGCGVGFKAISGNLSGFTNPIPAIRVIRTQRSEASGLDSNRETWNPSTREWTITVGDSAEAWAKSLGKLLAGKFPARTLTLDFSQIRGAGVRLKGYGWLSSGDRTISVAYEAIAKILSSRAGQLLRKMDIHDIANWIGTVLSTRRSAEISLFDYNSPEYHDFVTCKREYWLRGQPQREQSNNSVLFHTKPTIDELEAHFALMLENGGSEPGMINAAEALRRAPWFEGVNPCGEILLADKAFCNLVSVNLRAFKSDPYGLRRALWIVSRAAYRQTCVDLRDGILQESWHQNNAFLRLVGVDLIGQVTMQDLTSYDLKNMRNIAVQGAYSMADELSLPHPKNVTTGKPNGTIAKTCDSTEGIHKPLSRYIFNNVTFGNHDPLLPLLRDAGYRVFSHPTRSGDSIAVLPVSWPDIQFEKLNGMEVNLESAVEQLERYKKMMLGFVDQNQSITVSYSPEEIPFIIEWLHDNWDYYVGVSFLPRVDPTKTAEELGYPYLPQQPVTEAEYMAYISTLKPLKLQRDSVSSHDEVAMDCPTGACPIR